MKKYFSYVFKKYVHFVAMFYLLALQVSSTHAETLNIAIVKDGASPWFDAVFQNLNQQLEGISGSDLNFKIEEDNIFDNQWEYSLASRNIARALADKDVDIIVTLGLLGSDAASRFKPSKPIIATSVIEPKQQGFGISELGYSQTKNILYYYTNVDITTELKRFGNAIGARSIGLLANAEVVDSIAFIKQAFSDLDAILPFDIVPLTMPKSDFETFVTTLPAELDGVFVLPQLQLTQNQKIALTGALNAEKLPTFSMLGRQDVALGYLMGTALVPSPTQLAKRMAIDIRDLALGRSATELPVSFNVKNRFVLNLDTARAINYEAPFSLLFEADILNEYPQGGRTLSIYSAVNESLDRNLELAIAQSTFQSVKQDTRIARSSLLPQLNAVAGWSAQDRDRAGTGPTRSTTIGLSVSQSLYSESNRSNYAIGEYTQQAQEASLETTRLDVIQQTAQAYLNVLITQTERDIQRDNLKLTIANLERAKFRYNVGSVNRSEVHRFETELGSDRQTVSNSQRDYQQSVNELNRVLHRPITETFKTLDPALDEPKIFGDDRLSAFLSNNRKLRIFSNFLTAQTLENSPELVSLQYEILAQERALLASKRKRYVPDVDLTGDVNRIVNDQGALVETNYDNDWSIGVDLNWALYQGNRISAERSQAQFDLAALKASHQQTKAFLEATTRSSIAQAGASIRNIDYAKQAEQAAQQTLELVTSSYTSGKSTYIDLIDAQSTYIAARLASANNIYRHLLDLVDVQRAIGFFDFNVSPTQKNAWFDALDEYAINNGDNT